MFVFYNQYTYAQITVSPQVQHTTLDNGGSIVLNISGGQQPYSVQWEDNAITSTRTNLNAGKYTVTITDAQSNIKTEELEVKAYAAWTNIKGITITGSTIYKPNTGWNGGAFSINKLKQGQDGYFEHTITNLQDIYMIGFAATDLGVGHKTVDYQIYVANHNNQVGVRQFGSWKKH